MTKEIEKKILTPNGIFGKDDITPSEKQSLYDFMTSKGLSQSSSYLRFFAKGFAEWEIFGITYIKSKYLELPEVAKRLLEYKDDSFEDGDTGYLYTLAKSDEPGVFYSCLRKVELCVHFQKFMAEHGMMSGSTVQKRFHVEDWKPFEVFGIKTLLAEWQETTNRLTV